MDSKRQVREVREVTVIGAVGAPLPADGRADGSDGVSARATGHSDAGGAPAPSAEGVDARAQLDDAPAPGLHCCYTDYLTFAETETCCTETGSQECGAMRVMEMLSGKWRLKVLFQLSLHERMRFSELKKSIPGITSAMLTTALRELEGYGVVSRRQYEEIPPRVEYSLTQSGRDLYPIFFEMARWAQRHLG
ncbi:MAG: helix-turn-helix domain-containing protein [Coriobacteriales bacterium]|jgi:DNA-binding HxlR family transcriptional regulator